MRVKVGTTSTVRQEILQWLGKNPSQATLDAAIRKHCPLQKVTMPNELQEKLDREAALGLPDSETGEFRLYWELSWNELQEELRNRAKGPEGALYRGYSNLTRKEQMIEALRLGRVPNRYRHAPKRSWNATLAVRARQIYQQYRKGTDGRTPLTFFCVYHLLNQAVDPDYPLEDFIDSTLSYSENLSEMRNDPEASVRMVAEDDAISQTAAEEYLAYQEQLLSQIREFQQESEEKDLGYVRIKDPDDPSGGYWYVKKKEVAA